MSGWWDRKLGTTGNQPSRPDSSASLPQSPERGRAFKNLDEALKSGYVGDGSGLKGQSTNTCPNCGSGNVFTRTNQPFGPTVGGGGGTIINENGQSVVVSARCFDCNWNSAGYDLSAW